MRTISIDTVEASFRRLGLDYRRMDDDLLTVVGDIAFLVTVFDDAALMWYVAPMVAGRGSRNYHPVPREIERDACEYLMAVNYKILFGHFTRDHRDGEIRLEGTLAAQGGQLSDEQVEQALAGAAYNAARYGTTLMALLSSKMTLAQALLDLERQDGQGGATPMAV